MNQDFRFKLRDFWGKYPLIFYSTYGLKPINRRLSVTRQTQLVIEGYPRSANTFAVRAFQKANPGIRLAHHLHVPAQIIRAVSWEIPTLVLIRNPKDAVASSVLRTPQISVLQALKSYISFYQSIQPYNDRYIVGSFENVITNYDRVIQNLNTKFNTNFALFAITKTNEDMIFAQIQNTHILRASKPHSDKNNFKINIVKNIEKNYPNILSYAEKKYQEFISEIFI